MEALGKKKGSSSKMMLLQGGSRIFKIDDTSQDIAYILRPGSHDYLVIFNSRIGRVSGASFAYSVPENDLLTAPAVNVSKY